MTCGLCPAILPSSFLPLHLLPCWAWVQLTLSPGVTAAATAAKGGGGVCAGKEGVISSHPPWDLGPGTWELQGWARPIPPSLALKTH